MEGFLNMVWKLLVLIFLVLILAAIKADAAEPYAIVEFESAGGR